MEIRPNFSVRVTFGDQEQLVNRIYDHVHLFRPLGHSIVKLVTEDGFQEWHTPLEQGEAVAEAAGIVPIEREEISQPEYDAYMRYQASTLNDSWLEGEGEHPTL
jgi:hypothetical protein